MSCRRGTSKGALLIYILFILLGTLLIRNLSSIILDKHGAVGREFLYRYRQSKVVE